MCRSRLTLSNGIGLLLLTLILSALLLHTSLQPAVSSDEFSRGGGPPGTSAQVSFTHRLKSSWRVLGNRLKTYARRKSDALLHEFHHSRVAAKGSAPDEDEEAAGEVELDAAADASSAPVLHLQRAHARQTLLRDSSEPDSVTIERVLHHAGGRVADDDAAHVLPTPSQSAKLLFDHLSHKPAPIAGAALLPAPAVDPVEAFVLPRAPDADSPLYGLVVGTRFWATNTDDLANLQHFLERSLAQASRVLVALHIEQDRADTIGFVERLGIPFERVRIVPVTPWLGVSPALNALTLTAAKLNATRIMFQSVEVQLSMMQVRALVREFDSRPDALVVGAVLDGHLFDETRDTYSDQAFPLGDDDTRVLADSGASRAAFHTIDGHNAPWNTAALWHVPSLLQTGFLTVSDGLPQGIHVFGQEEVPTINMLQALAFAANSRQRRSARDGAVAVQQAPQDDVHRSRVTLLHVGEVSWSHSFASAAARKQWHAQKMRSKLARAERHMALLGPGLRSGRVHHRIARQQREQPEFTPEREPQYTSEAEATKATFHVEAAPGAQADAVVMSPSPSSILRGDAAEDDAAVAGPTATVSSPETAPFRARALPPLRPIRSFVTPLAARAATPSATLQTVSREFASAQPHAAPHAAQTLFAETHTVISAPASAPATVPVHSPARPAPTRTHVQTRRAQAPPSSHAQSRSEDRLAVKVKRGIPIGRH